MDAVLVFMLGGGLLVAGFAVQRLRLLVAAAGGVWAGLGAARLAFSIIDADPVGGILWALTAAFGAGLLAATIARIRRSTS